MGISHPFAVKLIEHVTNHGAGGSALMLGRQHLKLRSRPKYRGRVQKALDTLGSGLAFDDLSQSDGFADTFFKKLGFETVQSMDMSSYEGAEISQNLNLPVSKDLHGKFDLIIDGGTTEHVFDVRCCFENIFNMLVPGGCAVGCVPANNFFTHGFYQFGPDLIYAFWRDGCHCEVLECSALSMVAPYPVITLKPPGTYKRSIAQNSLPAGPVLLYYGVRKSEGARAFLGGVQSYYDAIWSSSQAGK
ncbi:MAG: hypothetical protein AAFQ05_10350 [Pseudomonadota bacterium]